MAFDAAPRFETNEHRFHVEVRKDDDLKPELFLKKDGFSFWVTLNVVEKKYQITDSSVDNEYELKDESRILNELKSVLQKELENRLATLSDMFA